MHVKKEGVLIDKSELPFECAGVSNPAVLSDENGIHLFYRAIDGENRSSIGYCHLSSPMQVEYRCEAPILSPQFGYESQCVEDPRIMTIENVNFFSSTAHDGLNAMEAFAVSNDRVSFTNKSIVDPKVTDDESADYSGLVFFPRRIKGLIYFLHRIRPDIQLAAVTQFEQLTKKYWIEYLKDFDKNILLTAIYPHEVSYLGGGCPPIETAHGWLLIYHAVCDSVEGCIYSACAALLDIDDPSIEIGRLPYPLFQPEIKWERKGIESNACSPSGAIIKHDRLYIYYGAADKRIACASVNLTELLNELMINQQHYESYPTKHTR